MGTVRGLRLGVIVTVALLCAGCTTARPIPATVTITATGTPSATSPASASSPTSASPPASASPSASAPSATRTDPNAPTGQCADAALRISVQPDPQGGGGGHDDSFVVFRNTGATSCVLEGSPGVSLVGHGDGTQLGRSAGHVTGGAPPAVTIPPGDYALAVLIYSVVDAHGGIYSDGKGHDPGCRAQHADGYRVYPPHGFRATFVRTSSVYACTTDVDWIAVQPVQHRVTDFTPTP